MFSFHPGKSGISSRSSTFAGVRSSAEIFACPGLGYGGHPFTTPEDHMSTLKFRMYPLMMAAIGVMAATGGTWRMK